MRDIHFTDKIFSYPQFAMIEHRIALMPNNTDFKICGAKVSITRQKKNIPVNILCFKHKIGRPGTDKDIFGGDMNTICRKQVKLCDVNKASFNMYKASSRHHAVTALSGDSSTARKSFTDL